MSGHEVRSALVVGDLCLQGLIPDKTLAHFFALIDAETYLAWWLWRTLKAEEGVVAKRHNAKGQKRKVLHGKSHVQS